MNEHASQIAFLVGLLAYFAVRGFFQRLIGDAGVKARRSSPLDRSLIALMVVGQVVLPALYVFSPWLNPSTTPCRTPSCRWERRSTSLACGCSGVRLTISAGTGQSRWRSERPMSS